MRDIFMNSTTLNTERAYAFKHKNSVLQQSSSGGAFTAIVDAVYSLTEKNWGGVDKPVVYGVAFDENFNVIHKAAYTKAECESFRGSKYVQSDLGSIYSEIMQNLSDGKVILFTGTPCQVAALRSFLLQKKIDLSNIFMVDIICHGTPNKKIWKDYVDFLEKKYGSKLVDFSFRHKRTAWKGYPVMVEFENGTKRINKHDISSYISLFRTNLPIRKPCFNCKFPGNYVSDLTIGDFWGIEFDIPKFPTKGGVSLIINHTYKGEKIISEIEEMIKYSMNDKDCGVPRIEMCQSIDYKKHNHNLIAATSIPKQYDEFWDDYENKGFEFIIKKYGGYNIKGKVKFKFKNIIRRTGLLSLGKKMLKKA